MRSLARGGLLLAHAPRRAVRGEQVEEGYGVERFRTEHAGTLPRSVGEQFQGDDRVDRGLPDHGLVAVLAHGPLVVDHVVQVDLARAAVDAGALHPGTRAGLAGHLVPEP